MRSCLRLTLSPSLSLSLSLACISCALPSATALEGKRVWPLADSNSSTRPGAMDPRQSDHKPHSSAGSVLLSLSALAAHTHTHTRTHAHTHTHTHTRTHTYAVSPLHPLCYRDGRCLNRKQVAFRFSLLSPLSLSPSPPRSLSPPPFPLLTIRWRSVLPAAPCACSAALLSALTLSLIRSLPLHRFSPSSAAFKLRLGSACACIAHQVKAHALLVVHRVSPYVPHQNLFPRLLPLASRSPLPPFALQPRPPPRTQSPVIRPARVRRDALRVEPAQGRVADRCPSRSPARPPFSRPSAPGPLPLKKALLQSAPSAANALSAAPMSLKGTPPAAYAARLARAALTRNPPRCLPQIASRRRRPAAAKTPS